MGAFIVEGMAECPVKSCTTPVDIIIQSKSGDRFGAHKHNLQVFGGGFPINDLALSDTINDVPTLAESTEILCLMLRFMHHALQPDVYKLPFDTVAAFADAVEKYSIYSAIGICKIYMSNKIQEHPFAVLGYACRNQYNDIASQAARLTLNADAQTVSKFLGPEDMLRWFKYREDHFEKCRLICVRARLHGAAPWRARVLEALSSP